MTDRSKDGKLPDNFLEEDDSSVDPSQLNLDENAEHQLLDGEGGSSQEQMDISDPDQVLDVTGNGTGRSDQSQKSAERQSGSKSAEPFIGSAVVTKKTSGVTSFDQLLAPDPNRKRIVIPASERPSSAPTTFDEMIATLDLRKALASVQKPSLNPFKDKIAGVVICKDGNITLSDVPLEVLRNSVRLDDSQKKALLLQVSNSVEKKKNEERRTSSSNSDVPQSRNRIGSEEGSDHGSEAPAEDQTQSDEAIVLTGDEVLDMGVLCNKEVDHNHRLCAKMTIGEVIEEFKIERERDIGRIQIDNLNDYVVAFMANLAKIQKHVIRDWAQRKKSQRKNFSSVLKGHEDKIRRKFGSYEASYIVYEWVNTCDVFAHVLLDNEDNGPVELIEAEENSPISAFIPKINKALEIFRANRRGMSGRLDEEIVLIGDEGTRGMAMAISCVGIIHADHKELANDVARTWFSGSVKCVFIQMGSDLLHSRKDVGFRDVDDLVINELRIIEHVKSMHNALQVYVLPPVPNVKREPVYEHWKEQMKALIGKDEDVQLIIAKGDRSLEEVLRGAVSKHGHVDKHTGYKQFSWIAEVMGEGAIGKALLSSPPWSKEEIRSRRIKKQPPIKKRRQDGEEGSDLSPIRNESWKEDANANPTPLPTVERPGYEQDPEMERRLREFMTDYYRDPRPNRGQNRQSRGRGSFRGGRGQMRGVGKFGHNWVYNASYAYHGKTGSLGRDQPMRDQRRLANEFASAQMPGTSASSAPSRQQIIPTPALMERARRLIGEIQVPVRGSGSGTPADREKERKRSHGGDGDGKMKGEYRIPKRKDH